MYTRRLVCTVQLPMPCGQYNVDTWSGLTREGRGGAHVKTVAGYTVGLPTVCKSLRALVTVLYLCPCAIHPPWSVEVRHPTSARWDCHIPCPYIRQTKTPGATPIRSGESFTLQTGLFTYRLLQDRPPTTHVRHPTHVETEASVVYACIPWVAMYQHCLHPVATLRCRMGRLFVL